MTEEARSAARAYARAYYHTHRKDPEWVERERERGRKRASKKKEWLARNPDKRTLYRERCAQKARDVRLEALNAYGGLVCSCDHGGQQCGPHPAEHLSLDHINGENVRMASYGRERSTDLAYRLRKEGYPPGYRVLCHNCNLSLGFYGRCPLSTTEHQDRPQKGKPRHRHGEHL